MPKHATLLGGVSIAAIAAVLLLLPLTSLAEAKQRGDRMPAAGISLKMYHSRAAHQELYNSTGNADPMEQKSGSSTPKPERPFPNYQFHGYNGG